ncbi:MAG: Thermophilic serine proteinase [Calditrichaeota bacterium]|nr:Thermophilic serine proteinase [Calditrichota bacterium]
MSRSSTPDPHTTHHSDRRARAFRLAVALSLIVLLAPAAPAGTPLFVKFAEVPGELDSGARQALAALPAVDAVTPAVPAPAAERSEQLARWFRVELAPDADPAQTLQALRDQPDVAHAERLPVRETCGLDGIEDAPDDPLLSFQWHLEAVNAFAAWDEAPYAEDVVIAILDNGVDLNHPDLQAVMWRNGGEIGGEPGFDDDSNGYVDDLYGWDAFAQDGDPTAPEGVDNSGHGTHCAGIAAAANDNARGGSGIARGAQVMAVRIGEGTQIFNTVDGILYAAINGADVISMSFAGGRESVFERDVVDFALGEGAILVAAAGNDGSSAITYPAGYEGVIGVAATDVNNELAPFSNRGWWVQAAAPGVDILSTLINGYGYSNGTSMATPLVGGVIALLKAENPELTREEALARIQQGARAISGGNGLSTPAGVVDAWRSVIADRPALAFTGLNLTDEDGDGRFEQGESATGTFDIELAGTTADNVTISATSLVNGLTVSGMYSATDLEPGPFTTGGFFFFASSNAPRGEQPAALRINADGWRDTLSIRVPVDPPWVTLDAGEMIASITDFGALGYQDYINNLAQADGVRLNDKRLGYLFHGSLMIGDGAGVADNAYGNTSQTVYDFEVQDNGRMRNVSSFEDREIWRCDFTDVMQIVPPVGLYVTQTATVYPEGQNILFLQYNVRRASGTTDLYVGLYCDWDIHPYQSNAVRYRSDLRLSYMTGGSAVAGGSGYAGVVALDDTPISGVRAVNNGLVFRDGFSDDDKLSMLSGGDDLAVSQSASDWSHLIAVRLDDVGPAATKVARFAVVAADSENDLFFYAERAHELAAAQGDPGSDAGSEPATPGSFTLDPAWPNPFNAGTNVTVHLMEAGSAEITVHDVLGRRVATLHSGRLSAGAHRFAWDGRTRDGSRAAAGAYLIEASANGHAAQVKAVLVK